MTDRMTQLTSWPAAAAFVPASWSDPYDADAPTTPSPPARGGGERLTAALGFAALLPFRLLRRLVVGLCRWIVALVVGAAIGAAIGFVVALLVAPFYGWEALAIGPAIGAYLGGHCADAGGTGDQHDSQP